MLLSFDIAQEAIPEHDDWHTHEHLPERLSIPGFLRGTRWVALRGQPRYFVMYEVKELATLTSEAYLERLNHPSPWTSKMMPHYRGMTRGFCSVTGSFGFGIGLVGLSLRFKPATGAESSLRMRLLEDILPRLPSRPGIGSVHLFEGVLAPEVTNEQRIRGVDAGIDWALLLTGYSEDALTRLLHADLDLGQLTQHGAQGVLDAMYRLEYLLTDREVNA
ncbi:MAG: hypothetical protein ABI569_01570 [Casimicrobiaceae bacterium]